MRARMNGSVNRGISESLIFFIASVRMSVRMDHSAMGERADGRMGEYANQCAKQPVGERMGDCANEGLTEWANEGMNARMNEWAHE